MRSIQFSAKKCPAVLRLFLIDSFLYFSVLLVVTVLARRSIRVCSADSGIAPFFAFFKKIFPRIRLWHHIPDYTPPEKRFDNFFFSALYNRSLSYLWLNADIITTPSPKITAAMSARFQERLKSTYVIRNIPLRNLEESRNARPRCLDGVLNIVSLGSEVTPQFLIHEIISALNEIPSTKKVHLVCLGRLTDIDYATKAKELLIGRKTQLSVEFPGMVSPQRVEEFLSNADLGLAFYDLSRSPFANFADSLKVWQYLSHGVPLFGSNFVSPIDELLIHGGTWNLNSISDMPFLINNLRNEDIRQKVQISNSFFLAAKQKNDGMLKQFKLEIATL